MSRLTPVFIVTSPRPRIGKTLIARVLTEYLVANGRPLAAFDVNPDEFALVEQLPRYAAVASIDDVRGQMALIDQLVAADETPKIIDLGYRQFERFFAVLHDLAFAREARAQGIVPVVLFVVDGDRRTRHGYGMLRERFPEWTLVPVFNEAVAAAAHHRADFAPRRAGGPVLTVPALSPVVRAVIERPGFSFAAYRATAEDTTTELYGWISALFLGFRELELRLLLEQIEPSLRMSA